MGTEAIFGCLCYLRTNVQTEEAKRPRDEEATTQGANLATERSSIWHTATDQQIPSQTKRCKSDSQLCSSEWDFVGRPAHT